MRLQEFRHDQSRYERPGQKWVCGRLADGQPCSCGPKPNGQCSQPDNPCKPQLSLRRKRNMLALFVFLGSWVVVGAALFLQNETDVYISPGELSFHHGIVRDEDGKTNCGACHDMNADHGWLNAAASPKTALDHSRKCLNCHFLDESDDLLKPHGFASGRGFSVALKEKFRVDVACSKCHVEHKGFNAPITVLSDAQCQSCHEKQFDGFNQGHPEFTLYPYANQVSVSFDHQQHLDARAKEMQAIGGKCNHCHVPSASGRMMKHRPFKETCAACHLNPNLFNKSSAQLTLLKLNPPSASDAADITPLMRLLSPELDRLAESESADPVSVHMATRRFIRQLQLGLPLVESQSSSVRSIFERLSADTVNDTMRAEELDRSLFYYDHAKATGQGKAWIYWLLASRLTAKDINAAEERLVQRFVDVSSGRLSGEYEFFKLLTAENSLHELVTGAVVSGKLAAYTKGVIAADDPAIAAIVSYLKSDQMKMHIAEIVACIPPQSKLSTYEKALKKELGKIAKKLSPEDRALPVRDRLCKLILEGRGRGKFKKYSSSLLKAKDKNLYTYLSKTKAEDLEKTKVEDCLKAIDASISAIASLLAIEGGAASKLPVMPKGFKPRWEPPPAATVRHRLEVASISNWRFEASNDSLVYTSTGHADPVFKAVHELAAQLTGKAPPKLLAELSRGGQCVFCHQPEISFHTEPRQLQMKWVMAKPKRLEKFNHDRHTGLDCRICHQFKEENSAVATLFPGYKGSFEPISRSLCARCHQPQKVGDSCLKCHNYHPESLAHDKQQHEYLLRLFRRQR